MSCGQCQGIETLFNEKQAAAALVRYRRKGPGRTTRMLIDALKAEGIQGMTLLDIGGGVGAIQHELLRAGLGGATSVEASPAFLLAARREARRQGSAGLTSFHQGDFVALAAAIPPSDIVTLDRVICCYPDMHLLVGSSAAHARRLYGLVYPRDLWWVRMGVALGNLFCRLRGNPFRGFVHPPAAIEAVLKQGGLKRRFHARTMVWHVAVYTR